jgi:hypothetical protein
MSLFVKIRYESDFATAAPFETISKSKGKGRGDANVRTPITVLSKGRHGLKR